MKRREFEQYLRRHDCFIHHHGGDHDVWRREESGANGIVPRHAEVDPFIAKSVCRVLGIPKPPMR